MFTLRGRPTVDARREVEVTWDNGNVFGEAELVYRAQRLAADEELIDVTPTGPFVTASLIDERAALLTLASLFYSYTADGDPPNVTVSRLERGAIA